ncbi:acylneuraminate cytidylyltransferase family protein [uncultured Roseibium sp.]|uniref:acylneuraminate cytidylyltransferase family protein n=1 Tax=uncultured Roseibium sp. TaxID=1936171 RepID=UPI00261EE934|nr:acylneuraminate cytidylyltransferase family protein [uncultured Roseibium sp.]
MILGHIGARMGSKGVPGKNVRFLCGKPLIDWSLEQLLQNESVEQVAVSTDDPELYEYAVGKGALEIGLRPAHLATDDASKWDVWRDALIKSEELLGLADAFVDLDCTSPLRDPKDIDNALELFFREMPDMVMSCCVARKNPYFNLLELDTGGSLQVSKPLAEKVVARQQAPLVYEHAASTYVVSPAYLRAASSLFEGRVIPYEMPPERCVDIDSEFDFKLVELLMKEYLNG